VSEFGLWSTPSSLDDVAGCRPTRWARRRTVADSRPHDAARQCRERGGACVAGARTGASGSLRAREQFCRVFFDVPEPGLADYLRKYFLQFAVAARRATRTSEEEL
jgi:hypothetical protein